MLLAMPQHVKGVRERDWQAACLPAHDPIVAQELLDYLADGAGVNVCVAELAALQFLLGHVLLFELLFSQFLGCGFSVFARGVLVDLFGLKPGIDLSVGRAFFAAELDEGLPHLPAQDF